MKKDSKKKIDQCIVLGYKSGSNVGFGYADRNPEFKKIELMKKYLKASKGSR